MVAAIFSAYPFVGPPWQLVPRGSFGFRPHKLPTYPKPASCDRGSHLNGLCPIRHPKLSSERSGRLCDMRHLLRFAEHCQRWAHWERIPLASRYRHWHSLYICIGNNIISKTIKGNKLNLLFLQKPNNTVLGHSVTFLGAASHFYAYSFEDT